MEKQVCKECGRELDISLFGKSKWGGINPSVKNALKQRKTPHANPTREVL